MDVENINRKFELILDNLVSNDNKNFSNKINELKSFIENDLESKMSKDEIFDIFAKAWRSLFFLFWNSDKGFVQKQFADNISTIILDQDCSFKTKVLWIKVFLVEFSKKWKSIDFLRLDKYIMLSQTVLLKFFEKSKEPENLNDSLKFFTCLKDIICSRNYNYSFNYNIMSCLTNYVNLMFTNYNLLKTNEAQQFLENLVKKTLNTFSFILHKKEIQQFKQSVLETIVNNVRNLSSDSDKETVKKFLFEQATSKQEMPEVKRKIIFKLYKMLKYNLDFDDVEDEDYNEKQKENVVCPVNDYMLRKSYTSKNITCGKLKRKIINSALKHQKRTDKIILKHKINENNKENGNENENESKDTEEEDNVLIESSSDEEYIIKKPKTNETKGENAIKATELKPSKQNNDKANSPSRSPIHSTEKVKSPKLSTSDKKSDNQNNINKNTMPSLDLKSNSESPKIKPKQATQTTPTQQTPPTNNLNKKLKTVIIDEDNLAEEKTKKKSKLQKVIEKKDDLSDNDEQEFDEFEDGEDGEDVEDGEEGEEEEYSEEELAKIGNDILKKYMKMKAAKARGETSFPEDEYDFDDEELEYLDDDDFDFVMNKPIYEEEDEQDDEGNDAKLNENLKQAYLTSQKNIRINEKTKVNLLGKKRNFNNNNNNNINNSNKKHKNSSNETPVKNNQQKTKVNFRFGLNNFNEYDQNRPISLSSSGGKQKRPNLNSSPSSIPTPLKGVLKLKTPDK